MRGDTESLQAVVAFCQKVEFVGFLSNLGEYVKGNFEISDLISVDFLKNGQIADCVPSGKHVTRGFLFKLLKLHFSSAPKNP